MKEQTNGRLGRAMQAELDGRTRVLLVEDDEAIQGVLLTFLRENGCEVDVARDGQEALDLLAGENFDVMVTDLAMPGIGGADVIDLIRNVGVPLPIVVISAHVVRQGSEWLRDMGVKHVLAKPFRMGELLSSIEEATAASHARGTEE